MGRANPNEGVKPIDIISQEYVSNNEDPGNRQKILVTHHQKLINKPINVSIRHGYIIWLQAEALGLLWAQPLREMSPLSINS